MASPNTTDEGANPADLDRQLLLFKLHRLGFIEASAEGGWRLTQHATTGLANLQRGDAHGFVDTQPANVRPWTPRRLQRTGA